MYGTIHGVISSISLKGVANVNIRCCHIYFYIGNYKLIDDDADNFIDTFDEIIRDMTLANAFNQGVDVTINTWIITAYID